MKRKPMEIPPQKICSICNEIFIRGKYERREDYNARRQCSEECKDKARLYSRYIYLSLNRSAHLKKTIF